MSLFKVWMPTQNLTLQHIKNKLLYTTDFFFNTETNSDPRHLGNSKHRIPRVTEASERAAIKYFPKPLTKH